MGFSVICPQRLVFAVKLANFFNVYCFWRNTVKFSQGFLEKPRVLALSILILKNRPFWSRKFFFFLEKYYYYTASFLLSVIKCLKSNCYMLLTECLIEVPPIQNLLKV